MGAHRVPCPGVDTEEVKKQTGKQTNKQKKRRELDGVGKTDMQIENVNTDPSNSGQLKEVKLKFHQTGSNRQRRLFKTTAVEDGVSQVAR